MKIDIENEICELTAVLKDAEGYLDCEHVLISNIKKQIKIGIAIPDIEHYLKKLHTCFEDRIIINKGTMASVNYRYAVGFLNSVITTPYWHSWMKPAV